jgi:rhodanese-related sulfurtransferase
MPLPGGYVPPGAQQGGTPILTVGGYPTVIVSGESGSKPNGDIEPLIIDVRSVREFRAEHVPGAQSIPIDELEDRMAEVALATKGNWNAPIWIYCRHGELAAQAQEYLASLGFTQVRNLGGLEDHQNSGRSGRAENPAWPWVVGASAAAVAVLAKVVCDPGGITGAGGGGTSLQKEMHRPYGAELRYLGRFCHFRRPYEVTTFGPHPSVSNEYGQPVSMAVQRQTFPTLAAATEYFNAEAAKAREAAPP